VDGGSGQQRVEWPALPHILKPCTNAREVFSLVHLGSPRAFCFPFSVCQCDTASLAPKATCLTFPPLARFVCATADSRQSSSRGSAAISMACMTVLLATTPKCLGVGLKRPQQTTTTRTGTMDLGTATVVLGLRHLLAGAGAVGVVRRRTDTWPTASRTRRLGGLRRRARPIRRRPATARCSRSSERCWSLREFSCPKVMAVAPPLMPFPSTCTHPWGSTCGLCTRP